MRGETAVKNVVRIIIAVVVLAVIVIGGVIAYGIYGYKYDFSNPQVAANFKEKYNDTCLARYKQLATKSGKTVSEEDLGQLDQACSCVRDGVVAALAKRGAMSGDEIAKLMQSDPELKSISQACSTKFGVEEPL